MKVMEKRQGSFLQLKNLIRKKIEEQKKINPGSLIVGREREKYFKKALKSLKREGKIKDFLESGNLSFSDVKKGIDFYVIAVLSNRYGIFPFSVTGEKWIEEHKKKHPENIIFMVSLKEEMKSLKERILVAIDKNSGLT